MASRNKVTLRSEFPAVKQAMNDAVNFAINHALGVGQAEAESRLDAIDNDRGYFLPTVIGTERFTSNRAKQVTGQPQDGRIYYEPWWGRFFEYGTVFIPAASFMRPAHRKMRKSFLIDMAGAGVTKFIHARVRSKL